MTIMIPVSLLETIGMLISVTIEITLSYLQVAHILSGQNCEGGFGGGAPTAKLRHARPSISTKKVRCHRELCWLQTAPFTLSDNWEDIIAWRRLHTRPTRPFRRTLSQ